MSLLRRLRGEPRFAMPCLGRTLTLYRQGSQLGLLTGLGTVALFNLPWHLVAGGEEVARPLVAVAGNLSCCDAHRVACASRYGCT